MKSRYINKYFITFNSDNVRQYAGRCLRRVSRNLVEVQLIDWLLGDWGGTVLWEDDKLDGCHTFNTEREWIRTNEYLTKLYDTANAESNRDHARRLINEVTNFDRSAIHDFIKMALEALSREPHKGLIARYMAVQNVMTLMVEWAGAESDDRRKIYEPLILGEIQAFRQDGGVVH